MPTLFNTFKSSEATGEGIGANYTQKIIIDAGAIIAPIGSIIAWAKSFTGVTSLIFQNLQGIFVQCDGQVLSDPDSPLDGQTMPDLNGSNQFPRGNSTSGGVGVAGTHNHTLNLGTRSVQSGGGATVASAVDTVTTSSTEAPLPPFYNVVWLMRVK